MVSFFRGLEKNNTREWFQARKEVYEQSVKAPMTTLVDAVNRELAKFAPDYINDPQKAIYRIYRDTRFSANKTPYKTHIAAIFPKRGHEKHGSAGLYFSVSHKEVEVAGGIYMPGPEQLLAVRHHLAGHHEEFRKLLRARDVKTLVGELQGEKLTRPPKGFAADHPAADLVRYKQWLLYVVMDPASATTAALFDEVVKRFRAMAPFIEFLNAPLGKRRPAINL
jgi:uncharacterized protein (TIGR02453 family)